MNEPVTWSTLLGVVVVFLVTVWGGNFVLALVGLAAQSTRCPACDRKLVRRRGKLRDHEGRYYCPFHDPRDAA